MGVYLEDTLDFRIDPYGPVEEECVFCGEERSPDQFEDGLRCKLCVEEQDGVVT